MSRERDEHMSTADFLAAGEGRQPEAAVQAERTERPVERAMDRPMDREPMRQPQAAAGEALEPLFDPGRAQDFRSRWSDVQIGFVDDPQQAVRHADELVAQVMKSLAESFAHQRQGIESGVRREGGEVSTEELRVALRRYRSFFERLLSL